MKKFTLIFLVILLITSITGCAYVFGPKPPTVEASAIHLIDENLQFLKIEQTSNWKIHPSYTVESTQKEFQEFNTNSKLIEITHSEREVIKENQT